MRTMWDAAYPPRNDPGCDIAAGYLHSKVATHGWTENDWAHATSFPSVKFLLPIFVGSPPFMGHGTADANSAVTQALQLGFTDKALCLDIESKWAAEANQAGYVKEWCDVVRAHRFTPLVYTSRSTAFCIPKGVGQWLGDSNKKPHLIPGSVATQWGYSNAFGGVVDLNQVIDDFPFWRVKGEPVPPDHPTKLDAPVCCIVDTPTGGGYWLIAEDGGIFAFGDAPGLIMPDDAKAHLSRAIRGASCTPDGHGLTLVSEDGGVFCLGTAQFHGSLPSLGVQPAPPELDKQHHGGNTP